MKAAVPSMQANSARTSQDTTKSDKTLMMSLKNVSWTVTANIAKRFNNQTNADTPQSPQQYTLRYL